MLAPGWPQKRSGASAKVLRLPRRYDPVKTSRFEISLEVERRFSGFAPISLQVVHRLHSSRKPTALEIGNGFGAHALKP